VTPAPAPSLPCSLVPARWCIKALPPRRRVRRHEFERHPVLKRALRSFGNAFGLALYDKTHKNVGREERPSERVRGQAQIACGTERPMAPIDEGFDGEPSRAPTTVALPVAEHWGAARASGARRHAAPSTASLDQAVPAGQPADCAAARIAISPGVRLNVRLPLRRALMPRLSLSYSPVRIWNDKTCDNMGLGHLLEPNC
jgi:hypothetical protein